MKKLLCVLLSLCLLVPPVSASAPTALSAPTHSAPTASHIPSTDRICLPLTALALAMLEQDLTYDPNSSRFVWVTLYYAMSLCAAEDTRAQITDQTLLIPSECVQDFFSALFAGKQGLPPVPDDLAHMVCYNPNTNLYELALGDPALVTLDLTNTTLVWDGLFTLSGTLTSPDCDTVLCTFRTLLKYDTAFGFSVIDFVFS